MRRGIARFARLAAHGVALGARLFGREPESEEGALLLAKAECLAGNARRLVGKWAEADARFDSAAQCLARVLELSSEAAAFCRFLGLLSWEQGLLEEGEALLRQSAREFRELEVSQEEASSRLLLGLLMLERERPERAVRLLQAGRAVLDPEARPWLSVSAEPALDVIRRVARKLTKTLTAGAEPRCACHEAAVVLRCQFRLLGYRVDGLQFA